MFKLKKIIYIYIFTLKKKKYLSFIYIIYMEKTNKEYFCYLCNYKTIRCSDWCKHINSQKHKRGGEKKTTKCDLCDYESSSHWNINNHKLSCHSTLEERKLQKYYCDICDVVFFCNAYMKKHFEGKYHKNKELANKYENELIERRLQENPENQINQVIHEENLEL